MRQTRRDDSKLLVKGDDKDETAFNGFKGKTRSDDLLLLCRPVSVYLTRLPESLVNENAEPAKKPAKKRKPVSSWRNGFYRRKRSRNHKAEIEAWKIGQSRERQAGDDKNHSGEPATSEGSRTSFDPWETSTRGSCSGVDEPRGEENEGTALRASLDEELSRSPAREGKLSEAQECKTSKSVSVNTAAPRVDRFSKPEESEMPKGGKSNSGLVMEKHADTENGLAAENRNENNPVSRPLEKETSRSPAKHCRKRKDSSLSESSSWQESLQDSKKPRTVLSLSDSWSSGKKIRPIHEVVVVVNRLDDSRSPLVEKWKNRVDLSQLDEVAANLRETVSISTSSMNQVEKENEQVEAVAIAVNVPEKIPTLGDPRPLDIHKNTDIVMCSSGEDSSDEDDDEIIEFLAARGRRKSLTREIHREEQSDEERPSVKTPSENRSKSRVKQTTGRRRRQRLRSCSTTDDGKSEISSLSGRSGRIQSKTPSSRSTRRIRRPSYSRSDASSCEENISPPLTRSKSRAAIDTSSHEDSLNSRHPFHRRRKQKFFYRISDSGSSDEADEANEKSSEDEDHVVIDEAENDRDVVESERIKERDNSLDSAAANEPKEQSVDLNRESEEKINQETCRSNEADKVTEEVKENEIRSVLEGTKNIHEVVESEEIERNDESFDSTAVIDSNLTSNRGMPFEKDDSMESSLARKKLATMKDAMVVLMRLEDLEDQCPVGNFECGETGDSDFPRDFVDETHEDHNRVFTDVADGDWSLSRPRVDSSQPENRSGNQIPPPGESLDHKIAQSVSKGQNQREKSASPRKKQIERNDKVSEPCTEARLGVTLTRTNSGCQEMNESDDEGRLTVDESEAPEMAETDVEMPLIIVDEPDGTRREIIASPPGAKTPSSNSGGPGNRSKCEEQQGVDNENISSTHRCITCDKLFKDAAQLEEHKISSGICSLVFRCTFCSCMFKTSIETSNHRCSCAGKGLEKRNSVKTKEHEEIRTAEPENSVVTTSETRPKGKKEKPATAKNPSRKKGARPRCRSDNLTCNVCSTNFDTKTDLSEHLYKHSPEELQEAFRAAKAKAMADSRAEQAAQRTEADSQVSSDKTVNGQVISDAIITPQNNNSLSGDLGALETQITAPNINAIASNTLNKDSLTSKAAAVCLCHRDTDLASLDETDLQIEMVLLCKYCHVIFRRRECLEVHYRASTICSINRTRKRCPSLFCANCQSTLNSWANMRQHLELHANQNSERTIRFVCNICRVVFVGFGALFYNHWTSHSKDSMFVAGRYNFPKFSVQTITGTEKLPVGARPDENYLFVAEHVCATCKEPFSTRRDLEQHQQSALCTKQQSKAPPKLGGAARHIPQPVRLPINAKNNIGTKQNGSSPKQTLNSVENRNLIKTRMFCDVCKLAFINEYWLSMHSENMHENHFSFIPTTIWGTPLELPFKCTKCSAFAASVSAIEKHWRTDVLHKRSVASSNAKKPSPLRKITAVTSSIDRDTNVQDPLLLNASIINVNDATSTQKSKVSEEPPIITIDDPDSNSDFAASEDISVNQSVFTRNEESLVSVPSITSTESIQVPNIYEGPVLENPLTDPPSLASDANGNNRTKTRALEDPCVNVNLSEISGSNLSASLVIGDSMERSKDGTGDDDNTESYRILLPNGASPGSMTITLSRTSKTDSAKEPRTVSLRQSSVAGNDKVAQAEGCDSNELVGLDEAARLVGIAGTSVVNKDGVEHMMVSDSVGSTVVENIDTVQSKSSDAAPYLIGSSAARNNKVASSEGTDSRENIQPLSLATLQETTPGPVTKNPRRKSTAVFIVPEIIDLQDDAEECENEEGTGGVNSTASSLETVKCNGDQVHTKLSTMALAAANSLPADKVQIISESGSGAETGSNSAVSKSGSSSRSKMIRAALKASGVSFEEERWNWLRSSSANRDIANSTGPKKQGFLRVKDLSELQAARNYTCVVCSNSFESEKLLDEHRRMTICGGSIAGRNHQYPRGIAAALVLPEPSERPNTSLPSQPPQLDPLSNLSASALERTLISQPQYCPPGGASATANAAAAAAERVQTSTHQSPMMSGGSLRIQDSNQGLPETRTPSLGYHALPPMVSTPTTQTNKHQRIAAQQRMPPSNPLPTFLEINAPTVANSNETSKFLCSICRSFQTSSLEDIKDHMTKHFSFRSQETPAVRVLAPSVDPITSSSSSVEMRRSRRQILPKNTKVDMNTATNRPSISDWTIKDTPQGPVIVTPFQSAMNTDLHQASLNSNNLQPSSLYNSQLIFRCRICKSAVYKSYPLLRNHAILVHGITDFSSLDQGNISQNGYLCTQCPNTSALFHTQEQFCEHVDSIHTHSCPSCQRVFSNFLTLRHHLEQCRVSTSSNRNTYGKNC